MHPDEGMFMTANTHFSTTSGPDRIPFCERLTCSVDDATEVSGLSRSMIYNKMKSGEIEWTKIGARRLIKVPSLLRLLGGGVTNASQKNNGPCRPTALSHDHPSR